MYLTVTANSALDRVYFIDSFSPGTRMLASRCVESVGGKGFDASVALRALNLPTTALGFVAGQNGQALVRLLERYAITHDLVWVEGETRVALVIVEQAHQRHSHIIAGGYAVPPSAQADLIRRFIAHLPHAQWVILAGSLPQGVAGDFYARLITLAHRAEIPVLVDCPGEPALQAASARPTILKMNAQEFHQTFGVSPASSTALAQQALEIRRSFGLPALVITCGEEGVIASTDAGAFHALPPRQPVVNAAGAGDATSAALAWRLSLGDPWPEALRWAAATGAATVLTEGTADCHFADVQNLYPLVQIRELRPS